MKSISPGIDLTKPEIAQDFMASSASLAEWNENYYTVKRACGVHPMWWLATMFGSGLYASKLAEWATLREIPRKAP